MSITQNTNKQGTKRAPRLLGVLNTLSLGFFLLTLSLFPFSEKAFGLGHGVASYPLSTDTNMVTTELMGQLSHGKGMGLQARYDRRFNQYMTVDAGIGFSDTNRSARFFVSTDIEVLPDFENQPRVSLRPYFESSKEYNIRKNIFGISPTVSKGFFNDNYAFYPFVGVPVGVNLDPDQNTYQVRSNLALGVISKIPAEGFENVLFNLEGSVGITNSFSGIFLGFTYGIL